MKAYKAGELREDMLVVPVHMLEGFALVPVEVKRDAERYRWLRNPDQDVSLVIDKVTGEIPADEFGCGGYRTYEYRAGDELDSAIDAAMLAAAPKGDSHE